MKSTVETLEGNKVKLSVEVDETEFDRDIDVAFRKIAREVRLPGFRPGKAPRRILEARIGLAPARQQALQDAIPRYLADAVKVHDVDIIAPPEVDITAGSDEGPVAFDATVEVRPQVFVPGYAGLRVELPPIAASEDEVEAAVTAELRRHGDLTDVDRQAAAGDFVTLDVEAERDGEPVAGLNTEDWLYELGRGWVAQDFDDRITGTASGETLTFTATPTGTDDPADFTVAVKKVQALVPPELTDEWVSEHLEFSSADEWRTAIRERLEASRLNSARQLLLERASGALAELVEEDPPEPLVNSELQSRAQNLVSGLQSQGLSMDQYMAMTGQDPATLTEGLRGSATTAVKVDLALRAVADAEEIEVGDEDLEAEYARIAVRVDQKPTQVRKAYERGDAVSGLRAEIRKAKALEWLLRHVEIVDTEGAPIDRDLLLPPDDELVVPGEVDLAEHDHDGHDHTGHDHDHGDDGAHPPTDEAETP
ncbi:MAG TPA: trigger factor [Acidimicrobiales bacterium]|nr:trigger factor [Acidimicrobiales bacterium]